MQRLIHSEQPLGTGIRQARPSPLAGALWRATNHGDTTSDMQDDRRREAVREKRANGLDYLGD